MGEKISMDEIVSKASEKAISESTKAVEDALKRFEERWKEKEEPKEDKQEDKKEAQKEDQKLDRESLVNDVVAQLKAASAAEDPTKGETHDNKQFPTAIKSGVKLTKDEQDLLDALHSQGPQTFTSKFDLYDAEDRLKTFLRKAERDGIKADLDGASSYGADILPESFSGDLYMRLFSQHGNLASYVRKVAMPYYKHNLAELIPGITVSAYSSYSNQNLAISAVTATSPTTSEAELTAKKFVAKTIVYNDLLSDVKVNLMRGLRQYIASEFAKSMSNAILNGDSSTTHMDEDYAAQSANIPEKMWKGLRYYIMTGSLGVDGTDAAFTLADLISVKATMKKYAKGAQKAACKWIFGDSALDDLVGLLLAQTAAPQMADYTIKNGEVQKFLGIDVLYSDLQREDLEIDGYADSTGTDGNQGFIALFNANEFVLGMRQETEIKVVPDDLNDRKVIQATMRGDFAPFETPSTTVTSCAGLYGYTN